jgi:hypothetical protein
MIITVLLLPHDANLCSKLTVWCSGLLHVYELILHVYKLMLILHVCRLMYISLIADLLYTL